MNEFNHTPTARPRPRYVSWMIALAALSIGGGAFAYAGGLKFIESLFVTVDVNGQAKQIELQPVGENAYEGTMQTQLENGRQADIHVRQEETGPGGKRTEVNVSVGGEGTQEEAKVVVERNHGPSDTTRVASVADLGDAKPIHSWATASGEEKAIYVVRDEEAGTVRLYTTSQTGKEDLVVRKAGQLPADKFAGTPDVSVGDNGVITLTWETGDDNEKQKAVIKIKDSTTGEPDDEEPAHRVRIKTHSGDDFEIGVPKDKP